MAKFQIDYEVVEHIVTKRRLTVEAANAKEAEQKYAQMTEEDTDVGECIGGNATTEMYSQAPVEVGGQG
jgi:hypothetical protein